MANLTANYDADDKAGLIVGYNVKAATKIFKGSLVAIADANGYLVKGADTVGLTFAGVAYEGGDNSTGADGAVGVRVKKAGSFVFAFAGTANQACIGKKAYAVDDNTVALAVTTANDMYVGDIIALTTGGKVRIRIDRATG